MRVKITKEKWLRLHLINHITASEESSCFKGIHKFGFVYSGRGHKCTAGHRRLSVVV